jgi:hypothetical protein
MEEKLKEISRLTRKKQFFLEQIMLIDADIESLIKSNDGQ